MNAPPADLQFFQQQQRQQNYFSRAHSDKRSLPEPTDLANRLEEARTSAKLLEQVVVCTPPSEFLSNDLIKEFSERCQTASQSIQGYMRATNPVPDNDTMESLIDTNEQLQQALNQHQRAALNARKQLGLGEGSNEPSPKPSVDIHQGGGFRQNAQASSSQRIADVQPSPPSRKPVGNGKGKATEVSWSTPGPSQSTNGGTQSRTDSDIDEADQADPFRDPPDAPSRIAASGSSAAEPPRLGIEPYHPGFGDLGGSSGGGGGGGSGIPDRDPVYRY